MVECIRQVANGAQIPVGKVRPSDVFEVDYKPVPGEGWQELAWFLADNRKEADVREIEHLDSVDDLIRYVHRLRTGKATNGVNREKFESEQ